MSVEEDKELRDLVVQTLQKKGVLGKVQAEIRASVFLALEEQDVFKDKSPFINRQLKEFVKTSEGAMVISLVREFLEFFNLEFTTMVFDPETHAGFDYKYEGRSALAKDLFFSTNDEGQNVPLLCQLLNLKKSGFQNTAKENLPSAVKNDETTKTLDNSSIPSIPDVDRVITKQNGIDSSILTKDNKESEEERKSSVLSKKLDSIKTDDSLKPPTSMGLSSLGGLPPLGNITNRGKGNLGEKGKNVTSELKDILDFGMGDGQYEEDFMSSSSDKMPKENKAGSGSEESEIEEEISTPSNNSRADEATADISISKSSGHGDYVEDI